jgi:hypothetical protein
MGSITINNHEFYLDKIDRGEKLIYGSSSVYVNPDGGIVVECDLDSAVSVDDVNVPSLNIKYYNNYDTYRLMDLRFSVDGLSTKYDLMLYGKRYNIKDIQTSPFIVQDISVTFENPEVLVVSGLVCIMGDNCQLVTKI